MGVTEHYDNKIFLHQFPFWAWWYTLFCVCRQERGECVPFPVSTAHRGLRPHYGQGMSLFPTILTIGTGLFGLGKITSFFTELNHVFCIWILLCFLKQIEPSVLPEKYKLTKLSLCCRIPGMLKNQNGKCMWELHIWPSCHCVAGHATVAQVLASVQCECGPGQLQPGSPRLPAIPHTLHAGGRRLPQGWSTSCKCSLNYCYTVESFYKEPAYKELLVIRNWFLFPKP